MNLTQDYAYGQTRSSTGRYIGIIIAIILHIGIIYALISGLAYQAVEAIKGPLQTKIIQDTKPPPKDEPPPPPTLAPPPPPYIPPPEVNIQQQATNPNAIREVTHAPPPKQVAVIRPPAPPAPPKAHVTTSPSMAGAGETCKPEFPSVSRDLQEEGTVVVRFMVDTDGSVSDPQIVSSSGHSRLDKAMLSKLSGCRFGAGKVDGVATKMPGQLKYTFRLDD